jgi:hypothetical protein
MTSDFLLPVIFENFEIPRKKSGGGNKNEFHEEERES